MAFVRSNFCHMRGIVELESIIECARVKCSSNYYFLLTRVDLNCRSEPMCSKVSYNVQDTV